MTFLKLCSVVMGLTVALSLPLPHASAKDEVSGACNTNVTLYSPSEVNIIGEDPQSESVKALMESFNDLVVASNKHVLEDILKHYNPQFISGDNLTLEQVKNLILETWKSYPNICYTSKPVEVRISGDWATIETLDRSTATAPPDKDIMNIPGQMTSESKSRIFFRKIGKTWEITSDSTIWEQAVIRYGIGEDVKIVLSAPEQVKAGESYSAVVYANVPEGTFSIVTIDNQPLIYPHEKVDDRFRALSSESNELQRVLKANTNNRNEIVTATLGLTNVFQGNPERPSLSLNGIATIVKRVNVVPITGEEALEEMKKKEIVKTSASGKVNLTNGAPLEEPPAEEAVPLDLQTPPENAPLSD